MKAHIPILALLLVVGCQREEMPVHPSFSIFGLSQPDEQDLSQLIGFRFINTSGYVVAPGESIEIPFETNLKKEQIQACTSQNGSLTFVPETFLTYGVSDKADDTRFPYSGTMRFSATEHPGEGSIAIAVTGGILGDALNSDMVMVAVGERDRTLYLLRVTAPSGHMVNTTKKSIALKAEFCKYQHGEMVESWDVTPQVKWSPAYSLSPVGYYATVSHDGVVSVKYGDARKSTPELTFSISCSYDFGGQTYTGSTLVCFGETHFVFFDMDMKQLGKSSAQYYACPHVSEVLPCQIILHASWETMYGINETALNAGNAGVNFTSWIIEKGWEGITESSELPLFSSGEGANTALVTFISTNTVPSAQEYYWSDQRIYYYFEIDNNYFSESHDH